jgi:hypothetical protein
VTTYNNYERRVRKQGLRDPKTVVNDAQ